MRTAVPGPSTRPRRALRTLTALVVPLVIVVGSAAPAAADTNTYGAEAVAGIDPAADVIQYSVDLTISTMSFTVWTVPSAVPVPWTAQVVVEVDVNGDHQPDFRVVSETRVSLLTYWDVLDAADVPTCTYIMGSSEATPSSNSASFTIDSACIGQPSQVSVRAQVCTASSCDFTSSVLTEGRQGFSLPVDAGPDVAPTTAPIVQVYRFWSSKFANAHFFTTSESEAGNVLLDQNWSYEGLAFGAMAATSGACGEGSPMFRFWSPGFQSHFYTLDATEKDHIVAADRNWQFEGVAYCAFATEQPGTVPLYRFWSPSFRKHFFTANQAEADHIRAVDRNWQYEGIAAYVLPEA